MWFAVEHCPQLAKKEKCLNQLSFSISLSSTFRMCVGQSAQLKNKQTKKNTDSSSIVFPQEEYKSNLAHEEAKAQATIYNPLRYLQGPH